MMNLYRVENAEGIGPFHAGGHDFFRVLVDSVGGNEFFNNFPTPHEEGLGFFMTSNERVGCVSLTQLAAWFPKAARRVLVQYKFFLCCYQVPDARVGEYQAVFDLPKATLKKKVAIHPLNKEKNCG